MGYFNTDLLGKMNFYYNQLTTMFFLTLNLHLKVDTLFTDNLQHWCTFLDLIVVNDKTRVIHHGQVLGSALSKHARIMCVYSVRNDKPKFVVISV